MTMRTQSLVKMQQKIPLLAIYYAKCKNYAKNIANCPINHYTQSLRFCRQFCILHCTKLQNKPVLMLRIVMPYLLDKQGKLCYTGGKGERQARPRLPRFRTPNASDRIRITMASETSATLHAAVTSGGQVIEFSRQSYSWPKDSNVKVAWKKAIGHYMSLGYKGTYVNRVSPTIMLFEKGNVEILVSVVVGRNNNCEQCGTPYSFEIKPSWCDKCQDATVVVSDSDVDELDKFMEEYSA